MSTVIRSHNMVKGNSLSKRRGFSKLTKQEKLSWVMDNFVHSSSQGHVKNILKNHWYKDNDLQRRFDDISENTLSNFYLPFGIAPHFFIDGEEVCIPMVIEESSVVAAAASSAKFWASRGGFKTKILGTKKIGQVHFLWGGLQSEKKLLFQYIEENKEVILRSLAPLNKKMEARGGGSLDLELIDKTMDLEDYFQLKVTFDTREAMGANYINTNLESIAHFLEKNMPCSPLLSRGGRRSVEILMAIVSNYNPDCLVRVWVDCAIEELNDPCLGMSGSEFARKFSLATEIARIDKFRAATHNKGIMNGVDSLIIATGNDFRAIEAGIHLFAAQDGQYRGLSQAKVEDGRFFFSMDLPLPLGTIGGLTKMHPLVDIAFKILGNPNAETLMRYVAGLGLAQNFAALKSLVTTGIQKGHMKLHFLNILEQLGATEEERIKAKNYFSGQTVSYSAVQEFLLNDRVIQ